MRGAFVFLVVCSGCGTDDRSHALPAESFEVLPSPDIPTKRPTIRFYEERTSDRCSLYSEDGGQRSAVVDAPCPEDLLLGERVRMAGMTCMREGAGGDRNLPVVCPTYLLAFEHSYRVALASASASASSSAAPRASASAPPGSRR